MANIRIASQLYCGIAAACLSLFIATTPAQANVLISGTRQIYPAQEREITVQLSNRSNKPALMQAWMDDGDATATPGNAKAPFIVMPPVFRIDAMKGQALRIVKTGAGLPQDRESMFWLNVLEIPAQAKSEVDRNLLQIAFRSRIKVFHRPEHLPGTPADAAQALSWSLVRKGDAYALRASNGSAYFVTVAQVELNAAGKRYPSQDGASVSPGGTQDFALAGNPESTPPDTKVTYGWMNDFGAVTSRTTALGR